MQQHDATLHFVIREGVADVRISPESDQRIGDDRERLAVLADALRQPRIFDRELSNDIHRGPPAKARLAMVQAVA
ncbi:hypothetical protein [Bradyrhizobium diazoefficiens]|uniref:hypothetical protein n=1 Tax=Bradyrhizobium diazoefficiens TaxID=1355477 RepID=UPI0036F3B092